MISRSGRQALPSIRQRNIFSNDSLLILFARNVYVLWPRLRQQENPVIYNQALTLLITLFVLAGFSLASFLPFGREFPLSHLGSLVNAFVLSYAVVGQQLVDIRQVLRRGLNWFCMAVIGLACYWILLLGFHAILGILLTPALMFAASISAIVSVILIYKVQDLISHFMGKAFQGESYDYRERLSEFAGKIHNVFNLKDQGGELLGLVTHAVNCRKAGLLFLALNDDFEMQLVEPDSPENSISNLKLRGDNPIVQYLNRERSSLTGRM